MTFYLLSLAAAVLLTFTGVALLGSDKFEGFENSGDIQDAHGYNPHIAAALTKSDRIALVIAAITTTVAAVTIVGAPAVIVVTLADDLTGAFIGVFFEFAPKPDPLNLH